MKRLLVLGFLATLLAPSALADAPQPTLILKDHKFLPGEIHV